MLTGKVQNSMNPLHQYITHGSALMPEKTKTENLISLQNF